MTMLNPKLAVFAAELSDFIDSQLEKNPEFADIFGPVGVILTTCDGPTAQFYEEGIEFYPKLKITEEKDA